MTPSQKTASRTKKVIAWLGTSHWPLTTLSFISSFINMALPLVLVRILSRQEVGIFKVFFLYLSLFPLLSLAGGVLNGLFYWAGHKESREEMLHISGVLLLCTAAVWMSCSFFFFDDVQRAFGWDSFSTACFIVAMLGALAGPFFEDSAIATGRIWTGALFLSGFEILRTGALVIAVLITKSLQTLLVIHVGANLLRVVIGYALAYRYGLFGIKTTWQNVRKVLKYSAPISAAWAFGVFIKSADQLILSTLIPSAEFALYSIGCLAIPPLFIYEQSVTRVLIPQLSESFATKKYDQAARLFREAMVHLGLLFIPSVAGLVLFASPIINLLFTQEYAEASYYLELFALTYLFNIFPYDSVARASGDSPWIMRTFIAFSIITALLVYPLSRMYGPFGALTSFILTGTALRLYALRYSLKVTGWSLNQMIPFGALAKSLIVSLFLSSCSMALNPLFSDKVWWFLTAGPIFLLAYFPLYAGLSSLLRLFTPLSKNVLIITQKIDIGGLERTILNVTKSLEAEGEWKCLVFAYDQEPGHREQSLSPQFAAAGIEVHEFHKKGSFSLKAVGKILWYIFFRDVRILHTQDLGSLMYGSIAKIISFFGVRVLHTQHSFVHLDYHHRYKTYEKIFSRFADKITVVSEPLREVYGSLGFDISQIKVLENGIDFSKEAPSSERKEHARDELFVRLGLTIPSSMRNSTWLLYLARLYPGKGQDTFLEIWNKLPHDIRSTCITLFVGPESKPGELSRLQNIANSCFDKERLFFVGATTEPATWLTASDVFISCSNYEGMPIGPLEAAGSGVPCILSDIKGHRLLGDYCPLVDCSNPEKAATEIVRLLNIIKVDSTWKNTRTLRERYSVESMAKQYSDLYETLRIPQLTWSKKILNTKKEKE